MTVHSVLLTLEDVVSVLEVMNFMFWAPLEKSWGLCCLRAAVPMAIWSAMRLAVVACYGEPCEEPMIGFIVAPVLAMGYAVVARVVVVGGRWVWRR